MSYVHHTILHLEDDPDDARFVRLALQRVGVITPVQTVGDSASYPLPVLILLDLIATRSGLEFPGRLRQEPALKRLPAVVSTSCRETADINRAYELGCNSYLVKPASFNTLLVMMQTLAQLGLNEAPRVPSLT